MSTIHPAPAPLRLRGSYSRLYCGYNPFNDLADGGVQLHGVSIQQQQDAAGVYRVPGASFVTFVNPKYLRSSRAGANTSILSPNTTPGTIAPPIYLYGPHGFYDDIAITKEIPFSERWRFKFQGELLNAFNHPVFGQACPSATVTFAAPFGDRGIGTIPDTATSPGSIAKLSFERILNFKLADLPHD
ncbi:MAG: hypothetical protein DMG70_24400 [Acidobacteria bacterium]|nr:MAG: hypothetical protein DMG70_24400 [Acidobacteriota bacterium]PYY10020.1 MAG: hypothetical protein DMG69_08390 [Acidobacteriota bacterium]